MTMINCTHSAICWVAWLERRSVRVPCRVPEEPSGSGILQVVSRRDLVRHSSVRRCGGRPLRTGLEALHRNCVEVCSLIVQNMQCRLCSLISMLLYTDKTISLYSCMNYAMDEESAA